MTPCPMPRPAPGRRAGWIAALPSKILLSGKIPHDQGSHWSGREVSLGILGQGGGNSPSLECQPCAGPGTLLGWVL